MINRLSPYAPCTIDEALAFLRRSVPDDDLSIVADLVNAATAVFELLTGRLLVVRTYRTAVTVEGVTTTADSAVLTKAELSTLAKRYDDAVGTNIAPGSRVVEASGDTAELNKNVTGAGSGTVVFGSEPLLQSGHGDNVIYARETPIVEVFSIKSIDDSGTLTDLDLTGMRLERRTGAILLPNDGFPSGRSNIQISAALGYRPPTNEEAGDVNEWSAIQFGVLRLAQANVQAWSRNLGRATEKTLGPMSMRLPGFNLPSDVRDTINAFQRM